MIDENKLLLSHLEDLLSCVKKGRKYAFSSFLNVEQLSFLYTSFLSIDKNYFVFFAAVNF